MNIFLMANYVSGERPLINIDAATIDSIEREKMFQWHYFGATESDTFPYAKEMARGDAWRVRASERYPTPSAIFECH